MSAGAPARAELAGELKATLQRLDELRHDAGELRELVGNTRGGGLAWLDIGRALVALAAAALALERAHRHAGLVS